MYGLVNLTQPAMEPVTVEDVKKYARIDTDVEDAIVTYWITAARRLVEKHTNKRFINQNLRLTLEQWPGPWPWSMGAHAALVGHVPPPLGYHPDSRRHMLFLSGGFPVRLPCQPASAILQVQYYDFVGNFDVLDPALYQTWLQNDPPLLAPAPLQVWPALQIGRLAPVWIDFTAGYGPTAATVPAEVMIAIYMTITYWNENRGDAKDPAELGLPAGVVRILTLIDSGSYV